METDADKQVNRALFGSDDEDDESDENADDVFGDSFVPEDDHGEAGEHAGGGELDAAPAEAVPEEEGHVNAEGLIYQQPRVLRSPARSGPARRTAFHELIKKIFDVRLAENLMDMCGR